MGARVRPSASSLLGAALLSAAGPVAAGPPAAELRSAGSPTAPPTTEPPDSTRSTRRAGRGFVPSIGLGLGSFDEALRLRVGGGSHDETRADLRPSLALGLAHPVWTFGERAWIDGHASVGVGVAIDGGRWQLPLREDAMVAYELTSWFTLRGGVGLGAVVDATRAARSYGEVGLVVSLALADFVEIVHRPFVSFPLGSEDRAVFGGTRSLRTSVAVVPLDIALRFRLRWLTFGP